ncbi:MAG: nicotinate-nucleotide--dimethylbenzimidazole phosphoribosyltransferase [Wujia sp.]
MQYNKLNNKHNHVPEDYESVGKICKNNWDSIAKPIDSLGLLEDCVVKLCSIAGSPEPYKLDKRAVVAMCGDHGVVCEGVTQTDSSVTRVVSENFAEGKSSVNHMSAVASADVFAVDIGMDCDDYPERELVTGRVINRKVARGTKNLAMESAMTREQCLEAISCGIDIVGDLKTKGYRIILTGEMGIGNTTPTSCLAAYLLDRTAAEVTGRGAGLSASGIEKKCAVVAKAVERVTAKYGFAKQLDTEYSYSYENICDNPYFNILAELGGFELAGMVGLFLGGIKFRIPIVIDGAISAVSALMASKLDARVPLYAFASHVSGERTGGLALEELGLEAIVHGKLCLGEGTGAVTLLPLLDMALAVYREMGTFSDYNIEAYHRF